MAWWQQFLNLLTNNEYFRAGFLWALVLVGIVWMVSSLLYRLHAQWLKMRQFFEPIKKPGKVPVETGPSPASILLGCIGRIIVTVAFITTVIFVLMWLVNVA